MEKVASWSSPVLRAVISDMVEGLQQSWRLPAPPLRPPALGYARRDPERWLTTHSAHDTSLITPVTLLKVTAGMVAISLLVTHLQFIGLVVFTLGLSYGLLRQLRHWPGGATPRLWVSLAPVLIGLGAWMGSANWLVALPWLSLVLAGLWVQQQSIAQARLVNQQTWPSLLQALTVADPLRQLVAVETLRQQARQGNLDASQRQILRQALQLLLRQEIAPELRQAILTALPQLSPRLAPRRSLTGLAAPRVPLYLQDATEISTS